MKTYRKLIVASAIAGSVVAGLLLIERFPPKVARAVETAFDHRPKEKPKIGAENPSSATEDEPESLLVPRFKGYFATGGDTWFALALPSPDSTTASQSWLKIGQKIGEFEIAAFDLKKEALTLKISDGKYIEVGMVADKVLAGGVQTHSWRKP